VPAYATLYKPSLFILKAQSKSTIAAMSTSNTDTGGVATGSNNAVNSFNPAQVNLTDDSNANLARDIICYLNLSTNEYNGQLGKELGFHIEPE